MLLAQHLEDQFADIVAQGVRRTLELASYAQIPPDKLRVGVTAGFRAIGHDLLHPPDSRFGEVFALLSEQRARQRFAIRDVCAVISLTEQLIIEMAASRIADLAVRLQAQTALHQVCIAARDAIIDSFWKVNQELLTRAEALIRQLSSPLLPVDDGVLVLPLLGAVDAERARQLLSCLLAGIVSHRARITLIDVTAITDVDSFAVAQLVKAARASQLLGSEVVFVGASAEVARTMAETMADQNMDLSGMVTKRNLQAGLAYARSRRRLR